MDQSISDGRNSASRISGNCAEYICWSRKVVLKPCTDALKLICEKQEVQNMTDCFKTLSDKHISYGTAKKDLKTIKDCKDACVNDPTCHSFDYNFDDAPYLGSHCWHHATREGIIDANMNVTHYSKKDECITE